MFSYFGSKSKIIDLYPPPKHKLIIEPFAGSARYALKYGGNREVIICDKYPVIVGVWRWLQSCSRSDILSLPRFKQGQKISETKECENLPQSAKDFLGFIAAVGNSVPRDKVSAYADSGSRVNPNFYKNIADKLPFIKHWQILEGNYFDIPNQQATWFIDPPYQIAGTTYKFGSKDIDYSHLGQWCKERLGQAIVCENDTANWLDFQPLIKLGKGSLANGKKSVEAIWKNENNATNQQLFFSF